MTIGLRDDNLGARIERPAGAARRRVVFTAIGSLGDLHPYLAVALGMQVRGHEVIVATSRCYQEKVESLGLGFRPVRPDSDWIADRQTMRRYMDLRRGLIRLAREWALPSLHDSYADTLAAVEGADLLVSQVSLAARLVAEKTGIAWVSTIHMPLFFFSACDLPLLPIAPKVFERLRFLGPAFWGPVLAFSKRTTRFLARPWYALRTELGLPPTDDNPLGDCHSPRLVLALFSKMLADRQPDWPPQTVITGFPIYDRHGSAELPPDLLRFLDDGPPPIVFTLGTAVSVDAGSFYEHSAAAARLLGRRAVLILNHPANRPRDLPAEVVAFDYARFSALFPRAAAIVHHGGVGTTGLAMRSGRPMLVMPVAWDQPDNAARVRRLGIARVISRRRYTPQRVAAELRQLLTEPGYAQRAQQVAEQMRHEDGVEAACNALENLSAAEPAALARGD
ncbi:MAG TPA: glycosyltransferase [Pirellulales bacterium]|nr:glycosyltransferase [Pirellulales bacterium]